MAIGAILGALGSVGGGMFTSSQSFAESKRNREFQREMSNTAHRRAVADLELAGLNPVLAARQPASTPGGSTGQASPLNTTQGALAGAQAQMATSNATSARTRAEIDKGALKLYQNNELFRHASSAARLAAISGVSPKLVGGAGLVGAGKDILDQVRRKAKLLGVDDHNLTDEELKRVIESWPDDEKNSPLIRMHGPTIRLRR